MNKLILSVLFLSLCGIARADFKTLAEKEAYWLKEYRDDPKNVHALVNVAEIREDRGKFAEALQTWSLVRKSYGTSYSKAFKDETMLTYNQFADWTAKRIRAKSRGVRPASRAAKRAAARSYAKLKGAPGVVDPAFVDLNGDGLQEMISYTNGGRTLIVATWNNGMWDSVWASRDTVSDDYLVTGGEGKGWPELFISYPDNGHVDAGGGHVMTNGESWITIFN